jgi:L-seryl-tRNA(Ser) seleniumtransferase
LDKRELLSSLPKVDNILMDNRIESISDVSRNIILEAVRETIEIYRRKILDEKISLYSYDIIIEEILKSIKKKNSPHLKRVINATGTVLHTNLGRAVLSKSAVDAVVNVSAGYSNLEFDIEEGKRGSRYSHVEELICKITGSEAAVVVNNNAAAVMLALSTLCRSREAVVSRGQLVEIGGSFRIPAVMELSGAKLVEVGTTNRTHLYDYENAINENTGVILKVHQSNYKILGFTEEVEIEELVKLGAAYSIPVLEDIGSGVFIDMSKYGLKYEPTVQNSIKRGIDVVTFSGDKMLGGPQAGIIAGKKEYIDLMKKNQLTRALRIDKMTLAALEATLRLYLEEENAIREIPGLNMLAKDISILKKDAQRLSRMIKIKLGNRAEVEIQKDFSQVGGGAMPLENMETYVVTLNPSSISVDKLDYELERVRYL